MNISFNLKIQSYKLAYLSALLFTTACFVAPLKAMDDPSKDNRKGTPLQKTDKEKDDKIFSSMDSLFSAIDDIDKEIASPQTPTSNPKKDLFPPKSAPPQLSREKREDDTSKNFTTPIQSKQKPKIPSTDPLPKKKKEPYEIYQDQVVVSSKFLDVKKDKFISKKAHLLFATFSEEYKCKKMSTLDITGLSARSRIYLLTSIINFKIDYLPQHNYRNYQQFENLNSHNDFWIKRSGTKFAEFVDKIPTTFKIGGFSYKLQQGATFNQKGSGRLHGLTAENIPDKYDGICEKLKPYSETRLKEFSILLLNQKKDGNSIDVKIPSDNRFLNGLNLLFDYEVARRLAKDDKFGDFPIINYIGFVVENLHNTKLFSNLTENKDHSLFQEEFRGSSDRISHAKNRILELSYPQNSKKQIRSSLKYLHSSDEDSHDEYSGDEEDFVIPKMQSFEAPLETISEPKEAVTEKKEPTKSENVLDDIKTKKLNSDQVSEPQGSSSTNKQTKKEPKKENS